MIYTVKIERDPKTGEMILPFPKELIDAVGWNVGDQLIWEETTILEDDGEYEGFAIRRMNDE